MSENRIETRKRTLRAAKVVYGDYRYVIDCTVRDQSESGARIKVAAPDEVPNDFQLFDVTERSLRKATVAWRRGGELGIHFTGDSVFIHEASDPRLARFRYM